MLPSGRSPRPCVQTTQRSLQLRMRLVSTQRKSIAYSGMSAVIKVLSEVKAKLVAAKEPGVDKAKIRAELE